MAAVVRVGVACIVRSSDHPNCVLMGRRRGSHGAGTLAFPGGHLELGEEWADCASREVKEETNLDLVNLKFVTATNDPNIGGKLEKHYITLFMTAEISQNSDELKLMEPNKCDGWEWVNWDEVVAKVHNSREELFDPIIHFVQDGGSPF